MRNLLVMEWIVAYLITASKYLNAASLCLSNVSNDSSVDNLKKTVSYGYVYHFSVDYDSTDVDDILAIHKYLMKKHNTNKVLIN